MGLLNLIPAACAQSNDGWYPHNFMYNYMYGGYFGFLPMLLFWLFIIVIGVVLVKVITHPGRDDGKEPRSGGNNAMDILKERYAKGEIDKKEFEEKKKDLR